MGEVVNLRLARKRAARQTAEAAAAENRRSHGLPKALRQAARRDAAADAARLDGHRLTDAEPPRADDAVAEAHRPDDAR